MKIIQIGFVFLKKVEELILVASMEAVARNINRATIYGVEYKRL